MNRYGPLTHQLVFIALAIFLIFTLKAIGVEDTSVIIGLVLFASSSIYYKIVEIKHDLQKGN